MDKLQFVAKESGASWTAQISEAQGSGYDVVLFLDVEHPTDTSGWMLELGVNADGSISGQITSRPGFDAIAIFRSAVDRLEIEGNAVGPTCVIEEGEAATLAGGRP